MANINLESNDFFTITKKIVEIADIHSQGRVISFLEGGYDLQALSESIIEHLKGLKEIFDQLSGFSNFSISFFVTGLKR